MGHREKEGKLEAFLKDITYGSVGAGAVYLIGKYGFLIDKGMIPYALTVGAFLGMYVRRLR